MAPRPGTYQAGFTAGELDRRVHGRTDIKQYYQGAARMQRALPVPQSGFTNEAVLGSELLGRIRTSQVGAAMTASFFANPGADWPNLFSLAQVEQTVALGQNALVARFDLGVERDVVSFDLLEFEGQAETGNKALVCETSIDGFSWEAFGQAYAIMTDVRSRRFALPPGQVRRARHLRLSVVAATVAPGVVSLRAVRCLVLAAPAARRVRRFTFSRDEAYELVFGVNGIDVWRGGLWKAAIPVLLTAEQVTTCDVVQQLDTMFVFHETLPPQRIMRQGADDEWTCHAAPFRNLPTVDYGAVYGNGQVAVFLIQIVNLVLPASIALNLGGEDTEQIDIDSVQSTTAAVIRAAIESLPSVEPGVTVVYDGGLNGYVVSMTGAGNTDASWTMTGRMITPASSAIVVSRRQASRPGGEPIMSDARGYPSCGAIYQQRLVLGGFRSKPNAWLASVSGDYFDLNIDIVADTGAYLGAIDTIGAERIERMVFGTFLHFLTSEREYYLTDATLKRAQPPNIRLATNNGVKRGVPAVTTDTTTLFAHRNGSNIIEFVYSDAEQNYVSTNISVLSTGLLRDAVDLAFRGAVSADDASALLVVNADGNMRIFVMLKQQDVNAAPGRFETDGLVRACCVTASEELVISVDRPVAGGLVQTLERVGGTVPLDCWQRFAFDPPQALVGGLAAFHEGAVVWAVADRRPTGPFTVQGGVLTLPEPAAEVYVGRWRATDVTLLPVPKDVGDKVILDRPVRVTSVRAHVLDTSSIALGSETDGPFDVDLTEYGDQADVVLLDAPVSKDVSVEGLCGYSDEGKVTITQLRPGRLSVREITVETER